MIRPRYEVFIACGGSCLYLCSFLHNITLPFHSLLSAQVSELWIFSSHVVAYIVSFDSSSWSRKADIIRPSYELFNACCGSCLLLCSLWHYVTFSFTPLSSSFRIRIFTSDVVAYFVRFDSSSWTWKSDIIRPRYEVFIACGGSCVCYTTLPYLFIHSSQLEFRILDFFIPCRSLYRKLWFKVWNSKIEYHMATLWAF